MNIARVTLLAAAVFGPVATAAHAESEGAGDPFPFSARGFSVNTSAFDVRTAASVVFDRTDRRSNFPAANGGISNSAGPAGQIQTDASLARGPDSTASHAQMQSAAPSFPRVRRS